MPDGHVQRVDESKQEVLVIRNGRRFVAPLSEVESAARVPGARVHFDVDRGSGGDGAVKVRLISGTRTNKRQRRFGDLTGAKRPGAKVKSTAVSRMGVDVTTQPMRVVSAWVAALADSAFDDAVSLYAPKSLLHTSSNTVEGRKAIRSAIEELVWDSVDSESEVEMHGFDQLIQVQFNNGALTAWFEVDRGAIVEHWHGIDPDIDESAEDGPAISIVRSGEVDGHLEERLREDLLRIAERLHAGAEDIRIKIEAPTTPSHPFSVSATIHAGAFYVRSHVTDSSLEAAINTVALRLRRQLERALDRQRRGPDQHRPDEDSWRHGDRRRALDLIEAGPIPAEREIVRQKAWGPACSSVDEAIWDMEQADYDFYVFREDSTDQAAIVWRDGDRTLCRLAGGGHPAVAPEFGSIVEVPASALTPLEAVTELNASNDPFVFSKLESANAFVVYRRFDGHYGLIEPMTALGAETAAPAA